MNNLSPSLLDECKLYTSYPDPTKRRLLSILYNDNSLSWAEIGILTGTYANKVRRDARRLGIQSRDKSEAQKKALETGRHPHPTKDKGHTEQTKVKISDAVADSWDTIDEEERERRRIEAQKRWQSKSPAEIEAFRSAAGDGVRKAAKEGSALERFLLNKLIRAGYRTEFHKEQWVIREKLQVDLYLPDELIAIEIDGPSHFEDIWGEEALERNQQRDKEKTGLLLERGTCVIRILQKQSLSEKYKRQILEELLTHIQSIHASFPPAGKRYIILGDS